MSESSISNLPISENQFRFCELVDDALRHAKNSGPQMRQLKYLKAVDYRYRCETWI